MSGDEILSDVHEELCDEHASAVAHLRESFALAVIAGDVASVAWFAPRKTYRVGCSGRVMPNVGEVIAEALDAKDYMALAMQLLLDAAAGKDVSAGALLLLRGAGAYWAEMEADYV